MLEIIEGLPKNVVGIVATGKVTIQDCQDVLMPAMKKSLKRHDKIRLYYELNSRFPGSAWDDLDLGLEHASCCERVAIVTDIGWVRLTVKALRFLIPSKIRVFASLQAEEGRAWITARPGSRADTDFSAPARATLARPRQIRRSSRRPVAARHGQQHPPRKARIPVATSRSDGSSLELKEASEIADCRAVCWDVRIGGIFDRVGEVVTAPRRQRRHTPIRLDEF
jgi:hypothetical protein